MLQRISPRSVALFVGATDTGKTTLIRELHRRLGGEVIDADVGQSWLGPPTCVSRGSLTNEHTEIRASYFVGDISPRGNFLQVLTGAAHCLRDAPRPLLIDTDGYIMGEAARAYKSELIRLVQPDVLVLLQRAGELNYYKLYARYGITVIEIPVTHGGSKPREARIAAREDAFRRYFQGAALRHWRLAELGVERTLIGHGEPLDVTLLSNLLACSVLAAWRLPPTATLVVERWPFSVLEAQRALGVESLSVLVWGELKDSLVGCWAGTRFEGLGTVQELSSETIGIWTPVERASVIQWGSLKVFPDGRHLRASLDVQAYQGRA
ncbi:hypothetical protein HRbin07_00716 [bacterium HR07]|nr:hypothetical protein HRbin07_00716 [bacterium HR07]